MSYDFTAIEAKWQAYWSKTSFFHTPDKPRKKYYILEMFAYPSGDIHMGHFRNYSIGDVVYRYKRMQGYDILHPFGWDAFGLPAEGAAIKHKLHPRDWTLNNIKTSRTTLQKMGTSYDWDREVITCLPDYYRWTQWFFLLLYKQGLAYRAKSPVNWCPTCKTGLANEQVEAGKCWRCQSEVTKRELEQWYFKITDYADRLQDDIDKLTDWPESIKIMQRNWIGRSHGTEIDFPLSDEPKDIITVFTTRPDTIYGVTFMVMAPEHPRVLELTKPEYKEAVKAYIARAGAKSEIERNAVGEKDGVFTGCYLKNPFSGEAVQLWVADYVLAQYGTGVVMGVPAHDQRDYLFAKKYNVSVKVVINPPDKQLDVATMTEAYIEPGLMTNSGPFNGVPSTDGIQKTTDYAVSKGFGRVKTNYHLKDWLLSRQRYWGAPIPMIHCAKCGIVPVPDESLPVLLPEDIKDFIPKGRSPLADSPSFMNVKCPKCHGPAQRDPDTMDTFVCSSWYFMRYSDPKNTQAPFDRANVAKWLPIDLYIGGAEHACGHLIYFRFFTKILKDAGWITFDEPAKRLFNHGMVLDGSGEVMSKSKGNVVSPIVLMKDYGVDVSRLAMLFFAPSHWEIRWTDKGIIGASRFLNRVWNMVAENLEWLKATKSASPTTPEAKKLNRKMHQTIKRVTDDFEPNLQFNTAISAVMELVNEIQTQMTNDQIPMTKSQLPNHNLPTLKEAIKTVVLLLAPMVPHITEELWELMGERPSIFNQAWPQYNPAAAKEEEIELVIQINGKVRSRITVDATLDQAQIKVIVMNDEKTKALLAGQNPKNVIVVPGRLVNIVI
jgi:leucyl-tRNA synthetase